jgi:CheY-like chemotaxis protein
VIGNVDRIAFDLQSSPRIRQLAGAALQAAMRGASLTTQLLAFARRQPLNPTLVRVDQALDAMLPLIKDAVGETVTVSCEAAPDLSIRIDPGQLEAALLNLALNARDAMPHGGSLRIEARSASIDATEATRRAMSGGEFVVIEMADSGLGMRSDVTERAFEPFFTTKETGKGSGLGLAMVYGFARQSGGTAEVESRVGVGTTIKLYIPRSEEPAPDASLSEVADPPNGQKVAVLVVEDQAGIRQMMADSLEEHGHEVKSVRTAAEAMEHLALDRRVRVLVTDVVLPGGMTGLELVRKVRELAPDLKVLTISGNVTEESLRALDLDGGAFLRKPFRASDLVRAVDKLLVTVPAAGSKGKPRLGA